MKRGELYTVSGGGDYVGKPRPAVILQAQDFDGLSSVALCIFTSDPSMARPFRPLVEPSPENGLDAPSRVMVDKVTTVRKSRIGGRIGRLDGKDVAGIERSLTVFLGLKPSPEAES